MVTRTHLLDGTDNVSVQLLFAWAEQPANARVYRRETNGRQQRVFRASYRGANCAHDGTTKKRTKRAAQAVVRRRLSEAGL